MSSRLPFPLSSDQADEEQDEGPGVAGIMKIADKTVAAMTQDRLEETDL